MIRQSEGGYSDYLIRLELEKPEEELPASVKKDERKADSKKSWKGGEKKLKFSFKEQREFETIDDDIAALEEKIETADAEILKNATNSAKLAELMAEKESLEQQLEEKMDRWVYLNDLNEQIQNQ